MKNIVNLLIILISLIILELFSQLLILTLGEKKYSILVQPFSNSIQQTFFPDEYKINWDFSKNKMIPGIYENKEIKKQKCLFCLVILIFFFNLRCICAYRINLLIENSTII